uniref:F-box domain-containing protein n=1 Tax=Ascaris lumbricoides TaxID=6252 RepID=A0A0M3HF93_ASCLU
MATLCDSLPDVILAIMGLLGLVRVRRFHDAFAAAAALFGVEETELYRQVLKKINLISAQDCFLVCRLAHCGVSEREFETVAAWKKHVALARSHLGDGKRLSFATYIRMVILLRMWAPFDCATWNGRRKHQGAYNSAQKRALCCRSEAHLAAEARRGHLAGQPDEKQQSYSGAW